MILGIWGLTNSIRPLFVHETRGAIRQVCHAQKRSPSINVQLVGAREVSGRHEDEITSQPHSGCLLWVTENIGNLERVDEFEVYPTKSVSCRKTGYSLNASKINSLLLIRQHALGQLRQPRMRSRERIEAGTDYVTSLFVEAELQECLRHRSNFHTQLRHTLRSQEIC